MANAFESSIAASAPLIVERAKRFWLGIALGFTCPVLIGLGWLAANLLVPSFDDVIHGCMRDEARLAPAHRTETCMCVAGEKQTPSWAILSRAAPAEMIRTADVAIRSECRASTYSVTSGQ